MPTSIRPFKHDSQFFVVLTKHSKLHNYFQATCAISTLLLGPSQVFVDNGANCFGSITAVKNPSDHLSINYFTEKNFTARKRIATCSQRVALHSKNTGF